MEDVCDVTKEAGILITKEFKQVRQRFPIGRASLVGLMVEHITIYYGQVKILALLWLCMRILSTFQ